MLKLKQCSSSLISMAQALPYASYSDNFSPIVEKVFEQEISTPTNFLNKSSGQRFPCHYMISNSLINIAVKICKYLVPV